VTDAGGPLLLAIETATTAMSVALLRGEVLVAEITTCDERVHSTRLLPALETLLAQAAVGLGEVQAFAVSIGPGSFTGLRIGLATVKGLAFRTGRPVAAVPTLAALAASADSAPGPVAALLDARRGEAYVGLYERAATAASTGPGAPIAYPGSEGVYTPDELAARLPAGCTLVVGEGAEGFASALAERRGPARLSATIASAARVGRLGAGQLARGEAVAAEALVPRYLRRAEAEVRRTGERLERIDAPVRVP
jgi:tRNA threonylcarbamoyladenosine biosynthesis protein TsaB